MALAVSASTDGPPDAYPLARGQKITASSGIPVQLARPLDLMVLADHSDMMGIATYPKYLYDRLENYESKTGGRVFAFAHNGNLSNGWMFPTEATYHGGVVDKEYVTQRTQNSRHAQGRIWSRGPQSRSSVREKIWR